ncbi:MAG: hypothetical protein JRH11_24825, partial [Deltaproteobacteria bacterium]|nr:hypothetical protein [Deltaproteobacteria bacterium]
MASSGLRIPAAQPLLLVTAALLAAAALAACEPAEPPVTASGPTLEESSETPVLLTRDEGGAMVGVTGRFVVPDDVPRDPTARANWFLAAHGADLGVDNAEEDLVAEATMEVAPDSDGDGEGDTMVVYGRVEDGVTVYGADARVRVDDAGDVVFAVSRIPGNLTPSTSEPVLTAAEAEAIAAALLVDGEADPAELVIINPSLFRRPSDYAYLAYGVDVHSATTSEGMRFFIDALTGDRVPYESPLAVTSQNRNVSDACNRYTQGVVVYRARKLYTEAGPYEDTRATACTRA